MKMIVKLTLAAALTAVTLLPAQARESHKRIYSNVTAEDMVTLLNDVVVLYHDEGVNSKDEAEQHQLLVTWYGSDGRYAGCSLSANKTPGIGDHSSFSTWKTEVFDSKRRKEKYPLLKHGTQKNLGYAAIRYEKNGQYKDYEFYKGLWWLVRTGHIQKSLPAAVYTLCPDFPSAASLGAKVNKRQTSTNYFELIKQDPGDRVKRPDLITAFPVERY